MPVIRTTSGTSSSWSDGNLNIPNMRGDGYRNWRNERHRGGGRGADHDGGHRGAQGGNHRNVGGSSYTPYKPPRFDSEETVVFSGPGGYISPSEWDVSKLDRPSVKRILFTKSFAIHDSSLLTLLSDRAALLAALKVFELGDSDTGHGTSLSDSAVQSLLGATPNLRVLRLDACTALTDSTLIRAFRCCPRLEQVRLTGLAKQKGSIRGAALRELKIHPELCPGLRELVLNDQEYDRSDMIELSKLRKRLVIKVGDSVHDGVVDNMIAACSGGGHLETWMDGRMIHEDVDMGIYGPGGIEMPVAEVSFYDVF